MAAKKTPKHTFHCEKCGSACTIYKKGKNHRVLVCPECGVLATNPIRLPKILRKAANVAQTIPVAGSVVSGLEEFGIIAKDTSPPSPAGVSGRASQSKKPRFDYERWAITGRG